MRLALLFSGQGQQTPDHLRALRTRAPGPLDALLAASIPHVWLGENIACEALQENRVAQPFIFAFQMAYWQQLRTLLPRPICAAGYSLGELAACCAAGLFDAESGLKLASRRAASMDACVSEPAGLLAIMGVSRKDLATIIETTHTHLAISNPDQHDVIGGLDPALQEAAELAERLGAMRVVRLGVRTPSHTALLAQGTAAFQRDLAPYRSRQALAFKVLSAIDGKGAVLADQAAEALAKQISHAMDWRACLQAVRELQPDAVLEIGPGRALAKMWNTAYPDVPARAVDDFRGTDGIRQWLDRIDERR